MRHTLTFESLEPISLHMHRVRFKRHEKFTFKAGQFINVIIGEKQLRSYSVASHPSSDFVDLIIRFPEGSRARKFFESLQNGDDVNIMGPFGRYIYHDNDLEKIHIVTGAGIGPNYSMIAEWIVQGAKQGSSIFFGVREFENIPHLEQFHAWQEKGLKFYPCLSRQEGDGERTFTGRVLPVFKEIYGLEGNKNTASEILAQKEFYICGQPEMVAGFVEYLQSINIPEDRIHFEKFESAS